MGHTERLQVVMKPYQEKFILSKKRYPCLVAAIGTGKTMMFLLKIVKFCEENPDSLALIVRKEYTDLRDSTIKDFEHYFGVGITSQKEYKFPNGSVIMFRHGAEMNVLKNINLSMFGIEQAEEFETDEIFTFLRDRLRRQTSSYRQGIIIANANGHNWIWKLWKNNPSNEEFDLGEATTFDNEDNLPKDFIADLRRMEVESPNHYKRYVLNSWEDLSTSDHLFTYEALVESTKLDFSDYNIIRNIQANDVARYGDCETVFTILSSRGALKWEQLYLYAWRGKDLMQTVGKNADLKREFNSDLIIIDDEGVGGGVTDRLREINERIIAFRNTTVCNKPIFYANCRTEGAFILKDLIDTKKIKLLKDDEMIEQLLTLRFKYTSKGQKILLSKEDMRKEGIKSPDRVDPLIMACYHTGTVFSQEYFKPNMPRYSDMNEKESNLITSLPRTSSIY